MIFYSAGFQSTPCVRLGLVACACVCVCVDRCVPRSALVLFSGWLAGWLCAPYNVGADVEAWQARPGYSRPSLSLSFCTQYCIWQAVSAYSEQPHTHTPTHTHTHSLSGPSHACIYLSTVCVRLSICWGLLVLAETGYPKLLLSAKSSASVLVFFLTAGKFICHRH